MPAVLFIFVFGVFNMHCDHFCKSGVHETCAVKAMPRKERRKKKGICVKMRMCGVLLFFFFFFFCFFFFVCLFVYWFGLDSSEIAISVVRVTAKCAACATLKKDSAACYGYCFVCVRVEKKKLLPSLHLSIERGCQRGRKKEAIPPHLACLFSSFVGSQASTEGR